SRTSAAAAEALGRSVPASAFFYRYRPDDEHNPYFGLLAFADAVVVTGDSIAMVSEALAAGKPVLLFDTGTGRRSMRGRGGGRAADRGNDVELGSDVFRLLMRIGARRITRDIRLVHRALTDSGRVAWLGEPWPRPGPADPSVAARTARRVLSLVGS
ncbi:MAG: ELM1/GtrOC1 family putative glycosyltransferase, partial [Acidobacteriota bacterium]